MDNQLNLTKEQEAEVYKVERQKVLYSAILSALVVMVLWVIKLLEVNLKTNFTFLANLPRSWSHIQGILTEPLVHGDFNHLMSNSVPLFLLLAGTLYFYRNIAWKVIALIWVFTGLGVWIVARENYHIGASGVVYGLAAFHALSGILRKDMRLTAISLLVVFLYGGMVWGVLPLFVKFSWESHLMGAVSGFAVAIAYRHQGPKQKQYFQSEEEEEGFVEYEIVEAPKLAMPDNGDHGTQSPSTHSTDQQTSFINF